VPPGDGTRFGEDEKKPFDFNDLTVTLPLAPPLL
jgi:hypothetical protein